MLKKIICLLLVLACSAALFACGGDNSTADLGGGSTSDGTDKNPSEESKPDGTDKEPIDDKTTVDYIREQAFFSVVNNSAPNVITTKREISNSKFGDFETCVGVNVTTILGEDEYIFEYSYERFNRIGEGTDGSLKTKVGPHTVHYKDGEYFFDGTPTSYENPDENALNVKLNLDKDYLGAYKISEDSTTLTTTVGKGEIEAILGVKINTTSPVTLSVITNGVSLYMITVDYTYNQDNVHVETSYTYEIPDEQ